jgi:4-amino-4-deoxy-L-arabinose transferase-like glycosyltransferase
VTVPRKAFWQSPAILVGLAALTIALRTSFWSRPLDMDEGLYAYGGWQLLEGLVLYRDLWDLKPPAIYFVNALAFYIGSPEAINIYIAAAVSAAVTGLAIFLIAFDTWGRRVAVLSSVLFALLSVSPYIQGCGANTEVFMMAPMAWALYFVARAADRQQSRLYVLSGLMTGLATLFKQVSGVAVLMCPAALLIGARHEKTTRREMLANMLIYVVSCSLPWLAAGCYFLVRGALTDFLFWQVKYPFSYMGLTLSYMNWPDVSSRLFWVVRGTLPFWGFAVVGGWGMLGNSRPMRERLLVLFAVLSVPGVVAGWNFFPHYFLQLVPALSLLSARGIALTLDAIRKRRSDWICYTGVAALLVMALLFGATHYKYFFVYNGDEQSANEYDWGYGPARIFGKARSLGLDLRRVVAKDETVFVWKHQPQINFYALRRTPVRSPILSLPGAPDLERATVIDFEARKPAYVVIFDPLPMNKFPQLAGLIADNYGKIFEVRGLPFGEQGVYRRLFHEGG